MPLLRQTILIYVTVHTYIGVFFLLIRSYVFAHAAKDVVLAEKPVISDDSNELDPSLLDELLTNIATLSSVYHKPPETFVSRAKSAIPKPDDDEYPDGGETAYSESPSHGINGAPASSGSSSISHVSPKQSIPATSPTAQAAPMPNLLGDLDNALVPVDQPSASSEPPLPVLLSSSTAQGLQISGQLL